MAFDTDKKRYLELLYKPDRSKKGNVDIEIAHLIDAINKNPNFYTTSSCAGRIHIMKVARSGRKDQAEWLFVSHSPVKYKDIVPTIEGLLAIDEAVWFREEPPILHIAARTIDDAEALLVLARKAGFKRCGIMGTKKRVMVEIVGTEFLDTIISKGKRLLVSEDYLKVLVDEANKKLDRSRERLDKFILYLKKL